MAHHDGANGRCGMKTVTFAKPFVFIKRYARGSNEMHFKKGDTKAVTEDVYRAAVRAGVLIERKDDGGA